MKPSKELEWILPKKKIVNRWNIILMIWLILFLILTLSFVSFAYNFGFNASNETEILEVSSVHVDPQGSIWFQTNSTQGLAITENNKYDYVGEWVVIWRDKEDFTWLVIGWQHPNWINLRNAHDSVNITLIKVKYYFRQYFLALPIDDRDFGFNQQLLGFNVEGWAS